MNQLMNPETMIPVGDVELCMQTFGHTRDPAILLIHGAAASMIWWEDELCERLATRGRFVIRYDQRDTGRSTNDPAGHPAYDMNNLAEDAIGILDALGVERAHIVGRSMSGGTALILAVDHPDRVETVTFMATTPGDPDLPPPTPEFMAAFEEEAPGPDDRDAWIDYTVRVIRTFWGDSPFFDEKQVRALATLDATRTRDLASTNNHFAIETPGPRGGGYDDVVAPALVVHGDIDPVFPLPHALALRDSLPSAELLVLEQTGHELPSERWDEFVAALVSHTARSAR
ncbi:carboxylesterase [Janibacter sp. HTCC2649]|uniref:alpha/beta fold hydrolase n=1 Tax=Janibacter sp. HTCC2649 TaxID=313589 RepID=UPI000066F627|nr:alpha/beta hydrolase [Janibacter sp. HTCC2649]EAP96981.1 carboxylesterase [Janibacter sp. HTCC2649]